MLVVLQHPDMPGSICTHHHAWLMASCVTHHTTWFQHLGYLWIWHALDVKRLSLNPKPYGFWPTSSNELRKQHRHHLYNMGTHELHQAMESKGQEPSLCAHNQLGQHGQHRQHQLHIGRPQVTEERPCNTMSAFEPSSSGAFLESL